MKGVILLALKEMVIERFGGASRWEEILETAGITEKLHILPITDIDDRIVMDILNGLMKVLNINIEKAGEALGDYWINVYAQKFYKAYFVGVKNAKEFLLKMDNVHTASTKNLPEASPPKFQYEWKDDNTLIMKYLSKRKLIDIMVGLIKGVGKYFNEELKVRKIANDRVEIVFPYT